MLTSTWTLPSAQQTICYITNKVSFKSFVFAVELFINGLFSFCTFEQLVSLVPKGPVRKYWRPLMERLIIATN